MPLRRVSFLLSIVLLSGCYRATFYRDSTVAKGEEQDRWSNFYIFGLVGNQDFDVHEFCPNGEIAVAKTGGNFATLLVSALTIGIYSPRKVYITCATGSARAQRRLELTVDERGEPLAAKLRSGAREDNLKIATAGAKSWRLSQTEGK